MASRYIIQRKGSYAGAAWLNWAYSKYDITAALAQIQSLREEEIKKQHSGAFRLVRVTTEILKEEH